MRFPALPSRNVVVARKYDRKDVHYRQAKKEGLRSRAGYKLEELDKRFGLFRKGMRVVDLGCWPGAWLQIASRRIGPEGVVVGVDLAISDALPGANVKILHGDASDAAVQAQIAQLLGGPADVVLSDMAPKLSGIKHADAARHAELVRVAIASARATLVPGGAFVAKLFMDAEYQDLLRELRATFAAVKTAKLDTTRQHSSELYVCARQKPA